MIFIVLVLNLNQFYLILPSFIFQILYLEVISFALLTPVQIVTISFIVCEAVRGPIR